MPAIGSRSSSRRKRYARIGGALGEEFAERGDQIDPLPLGNGLLVHDPGGADREPHLIEVGRTSIAGRDVALEALALVDGHSIFQVVGDDLDNLSAGREPLLKGALGHGLLPVGSERRRGRSGLRSQHDRRHKSYHRMFWVYGPSPNRVGTPGAEWADHASLPEVSRSISHASSTQEAQGFRAGAGLDPQQWFDVLAPPQSAVSAVGDLLPDHSRDLDLAELGAFAAAVALRRDLWEPLTVADPFRRRYRLMYEDHRTDVWTLSWMPGQGTGFHDHDLSAVGLAIGQGMVVEKQMLLPTGATRLELRPGDIRSGGAGYIHSAAWGEGSPAVSIHCYSPPLLRVGQYKVDEHGVLQRRVEHGRQELMDHTVGDVDPSRADG